MDSLKHFLSSCLEKKCTLRTIVYPGKGIPRTYDDALRWGGEYESMFDIEPADLVERYHLAAEQTIITSILKKRSNPTSDLPSFAGAGNVAADYEKDLRQMRRMLEFLEVRDNISSYLLESYSVTAKIEINPRRVFEETNISTLIPLMVMGDKRRISTSYREEFPGWFMTSVDNSKILCRVGGIDVKLTEDSLSFRCEKNGYDIAKKILSIMSINCNYTLSKGGMISTAKVSISHPWKYHILADIITNDWRVSEVAHVLESSKPLHEKKHLSFQCIDMRCTVSGQIHVKISDAKGKIDSLIAMSLISKIFEIYDERYEEIDKVYADFEDTPVSVETVVKASAIKTLRSQVPDLFIENYTREATILPEIVENVEGYNRVIRYPKGWGKLYASPDARYFVGLKPNRLENKAKYPYIVTCYTTDHMKREGTHTYKYYNSNSYSIVKRKSRKLRNGQKLPLPSMFKGDLGLGERYARIGAGDGKFYPCMREAFRNLPRSEELPMLEVMKQELWNAEALEGELSKGSDLCFRYFEELYKCSIFVVEVSETCRFVPDHVHHPYFWKEPYGRGVVILKHRSHLYHESEVHYELIIDLIDEKMIFTHDDDLFLAVMEAKMKKCSYFEEPENVAVQHINEHGKCSMVKTHDGKEIRCSSRPLNVPVENFSRSVMRQSFDNTNLLMDKANIPLRKWESSNAKELFFPDFASFMSKFAFRAL